MTDKEKDPDVTVSITDRKSNEIYSFDTECADLQELRDFIAKLSFHDMRRFPKATVPAHKLMVTLDKLIATREFNECLTQVGKSSETLDDAGEDANLFDTWGD